MLTTPENMDLLKSELLKLFPVVGISRYTLGGEDNASLGIAISLDPRDTWQNNIFENSRYAKFMLNADGGLSRISGWNTPKFRAGKVKDITQVIKRLKDWNLTPLV